MDDLIIRFIDDTENCSEEQLDSLIDDLRDVALNHGFKLRQYGEIDKMVEALQKEKEFVKIMLEQFIDD